MAQLQPPNEDTAQPQYTSASSLIDIAILDLGPLYEEGVRYYLQRDPARALWSAEKRRRLRIRTECRWARAEPGNDEIYLLNERGEGPREPLSDTVCAYLSLYAELEAGADGEAGYTEREPFCKVAINRHTAAHLRATGWVALEQFIDAKLPEFEEALATWRELLTHSLTRARAARQRLPRTRAR